MKYVFAGCVIALSFGSAALASDQLAQQLGVEPGVYTLAQLTEIKAAQDDGDLQRLNWAMERSDVIVSTQSIGPGAQASDQLARQLGVTPGRYTLAQLTEIKAAQDDGDRMRIMRAMESGDVVVSTQSIGAGARMNEQLARAIRVDAADYSQSELTALFFDLTD